MITYLTRIGWYNSIKDLDDVLLEKQIEDAHQIMVEIIEDEPAEASVQMWRSHPRALSGYALSAAWMYWKRCKKSHELSQKIMDLREQFDGLSVGLPPWHDDTWIMRSHRSNLIRENKGQYLMKFPNTPENMPYFWPRLTPEGYELYISPKDFALVQTGERIMPNGAEINVMTDLAVLFA